MDNYPSNLQSRLDASKMTLNDAAVSFAVFIPTNGRAENQITYDYLREHGYTGEIFLIVDDLDEDKERYLELYGDNVIVFDKEEWALKTDRVHNTLELRTVTYARNFISNLAKKIGLDYFAMVDDDLSSFSIRYEHQDSLKGKKADNVDGVFKAYVQYMQDCNIMITGFGGAGNYIGGLNSQFQKGVTFNLAGTFILKTDELPDTFQFRGYVNEDVMVGLDYMSRGHLLFRILDVMHSTPQRGSNDGGHADMYSEQNIYIQDSLVATAHPDKLTRMAKDGEFSSRINWNNVRPKILTERWRKV